MQVRFHPSQRPAAMRARVIDALRAGRIPPRFLYESPAQTARYLAYQDAWAPKELGVLYDRAFTAALHHAPPSFRWIGLGCGAGAKDARFVELAGVSALLADSSPWLLLDAMERIDGAEGMVVDLEERPGREAFGEERALFGAFGLLPNFDPPRFLGWLSRLLRPGELVLLSANLSPSRERSSIVAQYDNAEAHAWYAGALSELGLSDAGVEVRSSGTDDAWRIEVDARARRDVELRVFDATLAMPKDEQLRVFASNRFAPDALPPLLAAAGLDLLEAFVHENREEGVYLARAVLSTRP